MHRMQQQKGDQIDVCLRVCQQGRQRRNRVLNSWIIL
jgi:hypothetical protein